MDKKKKLLIIVGAVLLVEVLGFLLRNVGAGKTEKRPITIVSTANFNRWLGSGSAALSGKEEAGTYYFKLLGNIRLSKTAVIDNGHTVVLDMNGHTLTNRKSAKVQAFAVTEGASLTLLDGTVETAGADMNGGILQVNGSGCKLELVDVTLTNTDDSFVQEGVSGGVLYVNAPGDAVENPAVVTLKGNTVITGSPSGIRRNGGAIAAKGCAQIHMYGGVIQNGQAGCSGNIYMADQAKFYMHDGLITGGSAVGKTATTGLGGNVDIRGKAWFCLYGGSITGGDAKKNGGNVFISSFGADGEQIGLHIYGGSVDNGTAGNGGNIYAVDTDSVIRMYGGEVNLGMATSGGNVYLEAGGLVMRGGTLNGLGNNMVNTYGGNVFCDHGVITMYDGMIKGAMATGSGANIYLTDGVMDIYGGIITSGKVASRDVNVGGGNLYADGESVINMYDGTITRGVANYDQNAESSAAGGNVMLAEKAFMQMFGGEITDGMIYGSISRGGSIYIYGQPKGSSPVFHMYGGEIHNGETQGTMRGMAIGAYGESKSDAANAGRGTARIFGGIITFTGPSNSKWKGYTLYTNREDMECLRIYNDSGMQLLHRTATVGECTDSSHNTLVAQQSASCITPGWDQYSCATCGDWYTITEKTMGHPDIAGEAVTLDGAEGWVRFSCDCCGVWYRNVNEPREETEEEAEYTVPEPLAYPDYTFIQTPDTDQLRQTAVQAMRDLLSVQWCSPEGLGYYKNGSKKYFEYPERMTLGGVMYSGASAGLFQFLEFYDFETGQFEHPGVADRVKSEVGSACADSLLWSWSTVCNSFSCGYYPSTMVQKNGFITVGEYTYNKSVGSYYQLSTEQIVENNGTQVMARSYAKVLPADVLISSTDDHGMMVIEAPYVQTAADGSIDTAASYVMIQDQRGGIGADFYEVEHEDYTVHHSGRVSQKFTFDELLEKNYIPVTAPEFVGQKAYEAPEVTVEGSTPATLEDLRKLTVSSNYPLAVVNIHATDAEGTVTNVDKVLFNGLSEKGVPRSYALENSEVLKELDATAYSRISIEVVTSTGKRFTPIELKLN